VRFDINRINQVCSPGVVTHKFTFFINFKSLYQYENRQLNQQNQNPFIERIKSDKSIYERHNSRLPNSGHHTGYGSGA
jgi:hypothetical protein